MGTMLNEEKNARQIGCKMQPNTATQNEKIYRKPPIHFVLEKLQLVCLDDRTLNTKTL